MVYFLKCGKYVKIGYSKNVDKRISAIQNMNPNKTELICSFQGTKQDELNYHKLFENARIHGEWFELRKIIKNIERIKNAKMGGKQSKDSQYI